MKLAEAYRMVPNMEDVRTSAFFRENISTDPVTNIPICNLSATTKPLKYLAVWLNDCHQKGCDRATILAEDSNEGSSKKPESDSNFGTIGERLGILKASGNITDYQIIETRYSRGYRIFFKPLKGASEALNDSILREIEDISTLAAVSVALEGPSIDSLAGKDAFDIAALEFDDARKPKSLNLNHTLCPRRTDACRAIGFLLYLARQAGCSEVEVIPCIGNGNDRRLISIFLKLMLTKSQISSYEIGVNLIKIGL